MRIKKGLSIASILGLNMVLSPMISVATTDTEVTNLSSEISGNIQLEKVQGETIKDSSSLSEVVTGDSKAGPRDNSAIKVAKNSVPRPPDSNTNILEYFDIPNLGESINSAYSNQEYPQVISLTQNETYQFGVMWAKNVINLDYDFNISSYVYIFGENDTKIAADGLAFVIQNDERGSAAYGKYGYGLGAYDGIQNGVSIEMDTYYNGMNGELNVPVWNDGNQGGNNYPGHVALVETNDTISNWPVEHKNVQLGTESNPIVQNNWVPFNLTWNASTRTLTYKYNNWDQQSYIISDINKTFGGNIVRFGFTASTGLYSQNTLVSFNELPVSPVSVFYKDIDSYEEISQTELLSGNLGDVWKSVKKDINNYEFVRADNQVEGVLTQEPKNITYFYRKIEPSVKQYNVNFESNGGSSVTTQIVVESKLAILPKAPIREGYTFKGWYTTPELTTSYNFEIPVTQDIILYAKWEKDENQIIKKHKVTFESNGGSSVETQSVEENKLALLPKEPTKAGYTFKGWYTDTELTIHYDFSTPVVKNIILYAKWEKTESGSQIDNNKTDYGSGKTSKNQSKVFKKYLPKTGEVKSYLSTVGLILSMMLVTLIWIKKKLNFKEDNLLNYH